VNADDNIRNYPFADGCRHNIWIGRYDRPNDRLLELFADIHHPSEPAKYVGQKRSIHFVNSKYLLDDPATEICVRRDS